MAAVATSADGSSAGSKYDQWMKMLNDNKITSQNTWDMELIDYFHDSVFQGGKTISFQKASTTLDGCVKVYSSRVDSAATEVGRLLTNLQNDNEQDGQSEGEEGSGDSEDEDKEISTKAKRPAVARAVNTLVKSLDMITIKELDREEFVHPVFKKALTDFDEGGAKSLLLNMLKLDASMRVLFATTTSTDEAEEVHDDPVQKKFGKKKYDLSFVGKVFGAFATQETLSVCPSMPQVEQAAREGNVAPSMLQALTESVEALPVVDKDEMPDFDNYDNGFDMDDHEPEHMTTMNPLDDIDAPADEVGNSTFNRMFDESFVSRSGVESFVADENILQYLDTASKFTWAGPEHWKISNLKRATKFLNVLPENVLADGAVGGVGADANGDASRPKAPRKKKDQMRVSMLDEPLKSEAEIFKESSNTLMSAKLWGSTHVLPDDKHFSTRQLIHLWNKPTRTTSSIFFKERSNKYRQKKDTEYDENYFADKYQEREEDENMPQDMGDYVDDFHEIQQSVAEGYFENGEEETPIGSQVGKLILSQGEARPGAINFARVAKKVDVRLLKENIWDTLSHETAFVKTRKRPAEQEEDPDISEEPLVFSDLVSRVGTRYNPGDRKDLSTSYCFICLLHLANENGFTVEDSPDHSDLLIKGSVKNVAVS